VQVACTINYDKKACGKKQRSSAGRRFAQKCVIGGVADHPAALPNVAPSPELVLAQPLRLGSSALTIGTRSARMIEVIRKDFP